MAKNVVKSRNRARPFSIDRHRPRPLRRRDQGRLRSRSAYFHPQDRDRRRWWRSVRRRRAYVVECPSNVETSLTETGGTFGESEQKPYVFRVLGGDGDGRLERDRAGVRAQDSGNSKHRRFRPTNVETSLTGTGGTFGNSEQKPLRRSARSRRSLGTRSSGSSSARLRPGSRNSKHRDSGRIHPQREGG
jgi:hypothetical protein